MSQSDPVKSLPKEVDKRENLTRNFGEKYEAYYNRLTAINSQPIEALLKRPIHSSVYWRELPQVQGFYTYVAFLFLVLRKLPFTNPMVRVGFWIVGVDIVRQRSKDLVAISEDDINEISCFDLLKEKLTTWKGLRSPDFKEECEDWYEFNKPAYRVPIGYESSPDSLARWLFINRNKYGERPVQWHGEWEQENALVMDLMAPHADHWLTHH